MRAWSRPIAKAAGLLLALAAPWVPAFGQSSLEYAIKAAYLTKFPPFIDWPPGSFADGGSPFNLCLLGGDPFGGGLDRDAAAQSSPRPLVVRRLSSPDLAGSCQILYLATPAAAAGLPQRLAERPVLTVSDSPGVPAIIRFVVDHNHVRFVIDNAAAQRAGLRISSKLLDLALSVKRGGTP